MTTKNATSYKENVPDVISYLQSALPKEALNVFDADASALQTGHLNILKAGNGDAAPNFELPNAIGKKVSLSGLLQKGKVVLVFYRGTWCPYCNLQLSLYQKALDKIKGLNASLVAVSPQTPDHSLDFKEKNALDFEVLSDAGNKTARQYTTVFRNGNQPLETMTALGIDFDSFYGDDSKELPIPAVFVINSYGKVIFAKSEGGDYRNRVEVDDIIDALSK